MSRGKCDFGVDCDASQLFHLKECMKPTYNHLRYLNANSRGVEVPENYLILNRTGVNLISTLHLNKTICKNHRDALGLYWKRSKRTCGHPYHGNSTMKPDRGITPVMSRELWLRMQLLVPVGEAVCRTCTAKHKSELSFGDDVCNEIRDKVCQLKSCSEHSEVDLLTSYLPADLTCGGGVSLVEDTEDRFEQSKAKQDDDLSDLLLSEDTLTDTDTTPVMSQGSSWSQSRKSQKDIFNDAMKMLSGGTYAPLRSQPSQSLDQLKYFTKTYYIRQAKSAIELICESMAPGQSHDLLQLVLKSYQNIGVRKTCVEDKFMDPLTLTVIEAYKKTIQLRLRSCHSL